MSCMVLGREESCSGGGRALGRTWPLDSDLGIDSALSTPCRDLRGQHAALAEARVPAQGSGGASGKRSAHEAPLHQGINASRGSELRELQEAALESPEASGVATAVPTHSRPRAGNRCQTRDPETLSHNTAFPSVFLSILSMTKSQNSGALVFPPVGSTTADAPRDKTPVGHLSLPLMHTLTSTVLAHPRARCLPVGRTVGPPRPPPRSSRTGMKPGSQGSGQAVCHQRPSCGSRGPAWPITCPSLAPGSASGSPCSSVSS